MGIGAYSFWPVWGFHFAGAKLKINAVVLFLLSNSNVMFCFNILSEDLMISKQCLQFLTLGDSWFIRDICFSLKIFLFMFYGLRFTKRMYLRYFTLRVWTTKLSGPITNFWFSKYSLGENIKTRVTQLTFLTTLKKHEFTFLTRVKPSTFSDNLIDINMD